MPLAFNLSLIFVTCPSTTHTHTRHIPTKLEELLLDSVHSLSPSSHLSPSTRRSTQLRLSPLSRLLRLISVSSPTFHKTAIQPDV